MGHNLTDESQAEENMEKKSIQRKPEVTCSTVQDCGQDGPCATAPGCARHWAERNAELVRERDEARARADEVERQHDLARSLVPPSPSAMAEPAVAVLWALVPELDRRAADLERQRDDARAEAERLRLGRVELQGMHRAAVELARRLTAAGEALSRVLGRTVPADAAALVAERREALDAWGRARDGRP